MNSFKRMVEENVVKKEGKKEGRKERKKERKKVNESFQKDD